MKVAWDEAKNLANQKKHGVSFEEARALSDHGRDYLEIFDETHSDEEDRFIAIGPVGKECSWRTPRGTTTRRFA